MHCRIASLKSIEFKNRLGSNQHDITLTKEQFMTTSTQYKLMKKIIKIEILTMK